SRFPRYDIKPAHDTVLIIVVENFTTKEGVTLDKRRGSDIDFNNVKKIWEKIGFTVVSHKDLKADDIRKVVRDTANQINENSSSFVCLITTHGDMGKIYGSDSECLDFKEVTDAFKAAQCPHLAGKPKLFFIIANGIRQKENASTVSPDAATLATGSGDAKTPVTGVMTDAPVELTNAVIQDGGVDYDHRNDSIFRDKLDPDEPHFLIASSLAPGKLKLSPPVLFFAIIDMPCRNRYEKVYEFTQKCCNGSGSVWLGYKLGSGIVSCLKYG
ncbi:caspase-3-like, partial [Paramuricea clavata]